MNEDFDSYQTAGMIFCCCDIWIKHPLESEYVKYFVSLGFSAAWCITNLLCFCLFGCFLQSCCPAEHFLFEVLRCSHAQLSTSSIVSKNGLMRRSHLYAGCMHGSKSCIWASFQLLRGWLSPSSSFWFGVIFFFLFAFQLHAETFMKAPVGMDSSASHVGSKSFVNLWIYLNPFKLLNSMAFQAFTKNVPFQSALQGCVQFTLFSTWINKLKEKKLMQH